MRKYCIASFVVAFLGSVPAWTQTAEIGVSAGQSIFRNDKLGLDGLGGSDFWRVGDGFRLGVRLTLNTRPHFGHEIGYSYSRSKLAHSGGEQVSMPTHQYGYAFLAYMFPDESPVRPFVAGGGHFSTFYPPGSSVQYGSGTTRFGLNYGGGIKFKVSEMFSIRVDLRDYYTMKPFDLPDKKGGLHQIEASAGLSLYF